MATLNEVYDHAVTDSILRNRVAAAIATAAWNIFAEATPVQARINWAKDAIGNVMGMANTWIWGVCGNATVQAANFDPTDGDIQFIINAMVDDFAGATAA